MKTLHQLVIVDSPNTKHGRLMAECARLLGPLQLVWLEPTDDLPADLDKLEDGCVVAVPLGFSEDLDGGTIVSHVSAAIERLMWREIPVYIAAGNRHPNAIADFGICVKSDFKIDGVDIPKRVGTSGRAVLAAAEALMNCTRFDECQ